MKANSDKSHLLLSCNVPSTAVTDDHINSISKKKVDEREIIMKSIIELKF